MTAFPWYCCFGALVVGSSHQVVGEELPRKEEAICDILTLLRKFCNYPHEIGWKDQLMARAD